MPQVYQYCGMGFGALRAITFNLARRVDDIYMDIMGRMNFTAYPILAQFFYGYSSFSFFLFNAIDGTFSLC